MRALRFVWTLPTNLLGRGLCLLVSGERGRAVGGPMARGRIYKVRKGIGLDWMGGVTLGHHILYREGLFDGERGRLVLAHELAHTRQHELLGPLYLPLHIVCQTISAAISLFTGRPRHSRVHDHNPLEQTFICIAAGATDAWPIESGIPVEEMKRAFSV
jgi:hypothetical protein